LSPLGLRIKPDCTRNGTSSRTKANGTQFRGLIDATGWGAAWHFFLKRPHQKSIIDFEVAESFTSQAIDVAV